MSRGNCIVVAPGTEPKGRFMEGFIAAGETPYPGTIMQIDPTVALKSGRHTFKIYNRDADGDRPLGPLFVLREDYLRGRGMSDAYAAGDRCFLYAPLPGDELNVLVKNLSGTGTADDYAAGELMTVDDTTGKLIRTVGSPEIEPFVLLEGSTDTTADVHLWCMYTGY